MPIQKHRKTSSRVIWLSGLLKALMGISVVVIVVLLISVFRYMQTKAVVDGCDALTDVDRSEECYRDQIRTLLGRGDIGSAVDVVKLALVSQSGDCHTLAHAIGKDTYSLFKSGKHISINDPMNICAYGFWHGFMGAAVADSKTSDLKPVCSKMLGRNIDLYGQCYHGFGIGFVGDPPVGNLWGRPVETVVGGLASCDGLDVSGGNLNECYSGVFHQILNYLKGGDYNYQMTGKEILTFCGTLEAGYQKSCLVQFATNLTVLTGYKPRELISQFMKIYSYLDYEVKNKTVYGIMSGAASNGEEANISNLILTCFSLTEDYKSSCMYGIYGGIVVISKEDESVAKNKLTEVCRNKVFNTSQSLECREFVLSI